MSGGYGSFEFTVRKALLSQAVDWALPAVPSSATLPVHGCLKVTVTPERLRVAATDQQETVFADVRAVIAEADGWVLLPGKRLRAILAEAPDGDVHVAVKGGHAAVSAGGALWSLRLTPPDGYSELPDDSGWEFHGADRATLAGALGVVRHAVGRDAGRPAYTQVRIAEAGGVMFADATDAAQFARAPVPGFPVPLTVPGRALDSLVKLLAKSQDEEVQVAVSAAHVVFRAGPVTMAVRRSEHPFLDVDRTFLDKVAGNSLRLATDKAALATALRRVRINSDQRTSAVALVVRGSGPDATLTVTSRDAGENSAEETLPCSWDGGPQVLVVHAAFLADMLAAYPSPECEFWIGSADGPGRPPLLLRDAEKLVTGTCPQLAPQLVGYK